MSRTIAEDLIGALVKAGVQRIYGIVGDSLNPVTDAIRRSGKLQWIHVRHEEVAAFAAGAEAQLTGQLAVCAGSCGPGNLHLINGLFDAHRSMAPVLAIAAHIPSSEIGTGYFQETHPEQLFRECSHYCELISNPRQMPRVLQTAMQHAVSKRGVAVIVLSGDVAAMEVPVETFAHGLVTSLPQVRPVDADLAKLADLLNKGRRVTLFCGSGCAGAHEEVVALAEKLKAPVGYAFRGKEWVEHDNPCAVGMSGLLGWGAAYKAMHACDVLLLLGTDFPYDTFMPTKPKVAQIDIRAERLGRRSKLDLGLCGDVRDTIQAVLPLVQPKSDRTFLDGTLQQHEAARQKLRAYVDHVGTRRPIHPEFVAATLDELAAQDAVFTMDTGMCSVSGRPLPERGERSAVSRLLQSRVDGQRIATSDRRPGGLPRPASDLSVRRRRPGHAAGRSADAPSAPVAAQDRRIQQPPPGHGANGNGGRRHTSLRMRAEKPQLRGSRRGHRPDGREGRGSRGCPPGAREALASSGPALVDVVTDPNVLAMPPKATVEQAKGFALAMTKMTFAGEADDVLDTVMANWRDMT